MDSGSNRPTAEYIMDLTPEQLATHEWYGTYAWDEDGAEALLLRLWEETQAELRKQGLVPLTEPIIVRRPSIKYDWTKDDGSLVFSHTGNTVAVKQQWGKDDTDRAE